MKKRVPTLSAETDIQDLRLLVAETGTVINVLVNDLAGLGSLDSLLATTAQKVVEIFPTAGIAIYLLNVIGGMRLEEKIRLGSISSTEAMEIAQRTLRQGVSHRKYLVAIPISTEEVLGVLVLKRQSEQSELRIELVEAIVRFLATRILEIRGRQMMALQLPESVVRRLPLDPQHLKNEAKRVTATILFADVRSFTALSERVSPEILQVFLNEYFTIMEGLVKNHGGTLVKFLADGVLAVFGTPDGQKDHTLQAIRCSLAMVETFTRQLSHRIKGEVLAIGVGLHRGTVMAGYFGSLERLAFDIIGDTVNTASRIQGTAVNAVHISAPAQRAVRKCVLTQPLPPQSLKGKSQPQKIYIVEKVLD